MEIFNLPEASSHNDPWRANVGRLIDAVATPKFESELFSISRQAVKCECVTAFAIGEDAIPRVLLAANAGAMTIARPLADKYVAQYWNLDPANRAEELHDGSRLALRIVPEADIDHELYRNDCYTNLRIKERFTILQRHGSDVYRLNFYSGGGFGRFAECELNRMACSGDLLMSLLIKNDARQAEKSESWTPEALIQRLRTVAPGIPAREAEVCTAIMLGMTSEAIGLKLGISVNTVLTYRKRAYGRLRISCQNELMRLVLS
jgi:DNA-binding CsgD family transcriptional regulator